MVLITTTGSKVYDIHYTVSFLKQVKRSLVLLTLYELIGGVVKLCHYDGYLLLAHTELFVVMAVESIVFIVALVCQAGCRLTVFGVTGCTFA